MPDSDVLFVPPVERWERISPKYLTVKLVSTALGWLTLGAVICVPLLLIEVTREAGWPWWIAIGFTVVMLAWRLWRQPRWVRRWGYAERDEDVYVTSGLMFRDLTCVPYGRMQLVKVTAGPIERLVGLASVTMVTASTSVAIPGLDAEAAETVRDRFIARGERLRAGV